MGWPPPEPAAAKEIPPEKAVAKEPAAGSGEEDAEEKSGEQSPPVSTPGDESGAAGGAENGAVTLDENGDPLETGKRARDETTEDETSERKAAKTDEKANPCASSEEKVKTSSLLGDGKRATAGEAAPPGVTREVTPPLTAAECEVVIHCPVRALVHLSLLSSAQFFLTHSLR